MSTFVQQQVAELVRRGIAEARYGNRAAAAALLRRAVRLDPQHEAAWLWLGGVAALPEEAAFALRAALELNPLNESARRGLRELEAGRRLAAPVSARPAQRQPDDRWRRLRESRAAARTFSRSLWAIPIVLLAVTVGLRVALALQNPMAAVAVPTPPMVAKSAPTSTPPPTPTLAAPTATPLPEATREPLPTDSPRGAIVAYLATLEQTRQALREATDSYMASGDRRTTAERAVATRSLRDAVQRARERIETLVPPSEARDAQQRYLDGLARETEALDDVLAFYAEYNLARSNSAALRMQDARAAIDAATNEWDALASRYGLGPERSSPR